MATFKRQSMPLVATVGRKIRFAGSVAALLIAIYGCGQPTRHDISPNIRPEKSQVETRQRRSSKGAPTRPPEAQPAQDRNSPEQGINLKAKIAEKTNSGLVQNDSPDQVQPIHRPADHRPTRNDAALKLAGFSRFERDEIILYSDLPEKELRALAEQVPQVIKALENYFGTLPPDPTGRIYQVTGYLMQEPNRFIAAGLLPEGRIQPHEGWYRGNEFWWNIQPTAYYTSHLMFHEVTHCFMHVMPAVDCPPWYVEGMGEFFGTHTSVAGEKLQFGAFPDHPDRYAGWGRISVLQDELAAGRLPLASTVMKYTFADFTNVPTYAWAWAFCQFLDSHPQYQAEFRKLAASLYDGGFQDHFNHLLGDYMVEIEDQWLLFASEIQYGHDLKRSHVRFEEARDLPPGMTQPAIQVDADKGWQASRIRVTKGNRYRIRASGRCQLHETTKPWISEPSGISIKYFGSQPIGKLLACFRPDENEPNRRAILKRLGVGKDLSFLAEETGSVYLRINDSWNQLSDNSGFYQVEITAE